MQRIVDDEVSHAGFIAAAIVDAGGTPVTQCNYTFRKY